MSFDEKSSRIKYLIKKAIKEPELIAPFLVEKFSKLSKPPQYKLESKFDEEEFRTYFKKLNRKVDSEFENIEGSVRGTEFNVGGMDYESGKKLYKLILQQKPEVIVETGVCNGTSTAIILKALNENSKGRLYSIDLPDYPSMDENEHWQGKGGAVLPQNKNSGWIVPEEYRKKWELIEGDANYELPKLLEELNSIDLFIHDSEHSYQTMIMEMSLAWRNLSKKGVMLIDDYDWNNAFSDFSEAQETSKFLLGNYGLIKKHSERL